FRSRTAASRQTDSKNPAGAGSWATMRARSSGAGAPMNYLDLENLKALRDRELTELMRNPLFHSYPGLNPYVGKAPSVQEIVGQPGALAQDCVRALIIRQ